MEGRWNIDRVREHVRYKQKQGWDLREQEGKDEGQSRSQSGSKVSRKLAGTHYSSQLSNVLN